MKNPRLTLAFLKEFQRDYRQCMSRLIAQYGNAFELKGLTFNLHFFSDPKFIAHVLYDNGRNYIRPPNKIIDDVLLLNIGLPRSEEHKAWQHERITIYNSLLNEKTVKTYSDIVIDVTERHLSNWNKFALTQKPITINNALLELTWDNLAHVFLSGFSNDPYQIPYLIREFHFLLFDYEKSFTRLKWILPTSIQRRTKQLIKNLHKYSDQVVDYCLSDNTPSDNIIKHFVRGYSFDKKHLKDYLRTRCVALFIAGFDTVAVDLTWLFIHLSRMPAIAQKVRDEVKTIIGDRRPMITDLEKLVYTRAVVQETLRLSALPFLPRMAVRDDAIGNYIIHKNDRILIPTFYMHQSPIYWDNPEGFDPTRFLKPLGDRYHYVYLPFSAGPRACLGRNFAFWQMLIILVLVTQKYHLYLTPNHFIDRDFHFSDPESHADITMNVIPK
jgi:cytochrome P450